ncbi:hypothetical protein TRFO_36417 [Tritrichomonas foetus]|uniref:Uncharacterized protein n=1 Tax=Tritrichomonas foetus TaxID=1144522 RepID=A0A1J4JDY0_9EUKA|nr:hypothetical protein TRFO_36417 [Tritrichomonas foetus]|eukprot:OHS97362.1 hypothetical protein TRFO_36417 [Tritrichomonas foetus]
MDEEVLGEKIILLQEVENAMNRIKVLKEERIALKKYVDNEFLKITELLENEDQHIKKKVHLLIKEESEEMMKQIKELEVGNKQSEIQIQFIKNIIDIQNEKTSQNLTIKSKRNQINRNNHNNHQIIELQKEVETINNELDKLKSTKNNSSKVNRTAIIQINDIQHRIKKLKLRITKSSQNKKKIQQKSEKEPSFAQLFVDVPSMSRIQLIFRPKQE